MGFRFHNLNSVHRRLAALHIQPNPTIIAQTLNSHLQDHSLSISQNPIYSIPRRWHLGHSHHPDEDYGKEGEKIFRLGLAADIGLAAGKALTGYLSGSTAIIADAAHSVSDVVNSYFLGWIEIIVKTRLFFCLFWYMSFCQWMNPIVSSTWASIIPRFVVWSSVHVFKSSFFYYRSAPFNDFTHFLLITIMLLWCRFLAALRYGRLKLQRLRETKNTHMVTLDLYLHSTPLILHYAYTLFYCLLLIRCRLCRYNCLLVSLWFSRTWQIWDSRGTWNLLYAVGNCWWHCMACFGYFAGKCLLPQRTYSFSNFYVVKGFQYWYPLQFDNLLSVCLLTLNQLFILYLSLKTMCRECIQQIQK